MSSTEDVAPTSRLQTLTAGVDLSPSSDDATLPSRLKTLEGRCRAALLTLTLSVIFNLASFKGGRAAQQPPDMTFGRCFDQGLEDVALSSALQALTFGRYFDPSWEGVTLPSSLQTSTFASECNQTWTGVALPRGLQTVTFGSEFNVGCRAAEPPADIDRWWGPQAELGRCHAAQQPVEGRGRAAH